MVAMAAFRLIEMLFRKVIPNGKDSRQDQQMAQLLEGCNAIKTAVKMAVTVQKVSAEEIRDLHKWHDQRDPEGRPLWFFPSRLMGDLIKSNQELALIMRDYVDEMKHGRCPRDLKE